MTEVAHLTVGDTEMISTREAAHRIGLSSDYVARLVREGKAVGTKIGRSWFVDETSLAQCVEAIELEKQARSELLKAERQRELKAHTKVTTTNAVVVDQPNFFAFGQAVSVLALALLVGVLLLTAIQYNTLSTTVDLVAQSVTALGERVTGSTGDDSVANERDVRRDTASPAYSGIVESSSMDAPAGLLEPESTGSFVLLGAQISEDDVSYVQSLFSDPVTVELAADGVQGTVVPHQVDGRDGEPVEILLVPNDTNSPFVVE